MIFVSTDPLATHVPSGWKTTVLTVSKWSVKQLISFQEARSQILTVQSSEDETIILESGENWAHQIQFECAVIEVLKLWTSSFLPLCIHSDKFQILRVLSSDPESKYYPSELNATDHTGPEWDFKTSQV